MNKTAGKKALKTKAVARRAKSSSKPKKQARRKRRTAELVSFPSERSRVRSSGQAGDLSGLSRVEGADSESVTELLEEGNAFEAGVVAGVEAADVDEGEVKTHEVPEDDVPEEYLDED